MTPMTVVYFLVRGVDAYYTFCSDRGAEDTLGFGEPIAANTDNA